MLILQGIQDPWRKGKWVMGIVLEELPSHQCVGSIGLEPGWDVAVMRETQCYHGYLALGLWIGQLDFSLWLSLSRIYKEISFILSDW